MITLSISTPWAVLLWTLASVVALLLVLVLVSIVRTLLNRKTIKAQAHDYALDPRKDLYASRLSRLVAHETISHVATPASDEKFRAFHEALKAEYPLVFKNLTLTVMPSLALLFHWTGRDSSKEPILLMAHSDVVPVAGQAWTVPPFGATVRDGSVWGRGSFDDKSCLMTEFQAIEELLAEGFVPARDVYLASSMDEEISGSGATETVNYLKEKGVHLALVLDEGGAVIEGSILPSLSTPFAVIGVTEKGYANVICTATGDGGHSSTPKKNSPLVRLGAFMAEVDRHSPFKHRFTPVVTTMFATMGPYCSFPFRLLFTNLWLYKPLLVKLLPKISSQGAAMLGTTCCFTMAKGSDGENVIPTSATVTANIRVHEIQGVESSLAALSRIALKHGITCTVEKAREQSPVIDMKSAEYAMVMECIHRTYPDVGISPYFMTGGTDSRHYQEICDTVIRFSPTRVTNAELGKMHGIDESIRATDLCECVDFYKSVLKTQD